MSSCVSSSDAAYNDLIGDDPVPVLLSEENSRKNREEKPTANLVYAYRALSGGTKTCDICFLRLQCSHI